MITPGAYCRQVSPWGHAPDYIIYKLYRHNAVYITNCTCCVLRNISIPMVHIIRLVTGFLRDANPGDLVGARFHGDVSLVHDGCEVGRSEALLWVILADVSDAERGRFPRRDWHVSSGGRKGVGGERVANRWLVLGVEGCMCVCVCVCVCVCEGVGVGGIVRRSLCHTTPNQEPAKERVTPVPCKYKLVTLSYVIPHILHAVWRHAMFE